MLRRCFGIPVAIALMLATTTYAFENFTNFDESALVVIEKHGKTVYVAEDLMKKLEEEDEAWHWMPWQRTRILLDNNFVKEVTCLFTDSVDSFPDSIFTEDQLRQGAFLLYVLFGIYAFTLLAIVCNDYFIPCVELICEDLNIPQNIAAATFMSVATSCPEFFVNVISTFLTESDMGIGTIVGSAIFNALGVAAIGGLAAITPIAIDKRPVTRDVLIYMVNVGVLVAIVWDGQVDWYEAVVLGVLYVLYFIVMFNSGKIFTLFDIITAKCCKPSSSDLTQLPENAPEKIEEGVDNITFEDIDIEKRKSNAEKIVDKVEDQNEELKKPRGIFTYPKGKSITYQVWWMYSLPLKIILGITIPSVTKFRKLYPFAFFMCIVWIGINSYFVSWSVTVIGNTFLIPESVMGMTFLAFGGCLPEACSIFIMSRRGEGGIGVSNALGANSLAILFALGLPWLIKTLTLVAQGADQTAVIINSAGIDFVVGSLLVAVACLWFTLFIGKFILRKSVGFVLFALYIAFITFAILVETGVILERNGLQVC